MDARPIGVFDSGLGGLTVLAELIYLLPNENYIYVGDTARVPYGSRSKETIQKYSLEIAHYLVKKNIKLLVVACNTSSSYALDILTKSFSIPILGVIEPAIQSFFTNSHNTSVAVIGTRATINSKTYPEKIRNIDPEILVYSKACPLFVPLVEEDMIQHQVTYGVIKEYLQEIVDKNIQDILLGCTHYPLLKKAILKVYPHLNLIDSSIESAKYVQKLLIEKNLENKTKENKTVEILLTDITERVPILEKLFLEKDGYIEVKEQEISLKGNSNLKFSISVKELKLEELMMEKAL